MVRGKSLWHLSTLACLCLLLTGAARAEILSSRDLSAVLKLMLFSGLQATLGGPCRRAIVDPGHRNMGLLLPMLQVKLEKWET